MPTGGEEIVAAARALATDRVAAATIERLTEAGVDTVLLKGATLARLLYDDGVGRPYVDIDILVPPHAHPRAQAELAREGFAEVMDDGDVASGIALHAHPWVRKRDRAVIDLHRTLRGLEADPAAVWSALRRHSEPSRVGGGPVVVPDRAACGLHVALHAADRGVQRGKPLEDLRRALARLSEHDWLQAAGLAHELAGVDAFAVGLGQLPDGARLAERLGVEGGRSVHVLLDATGAPPLAHGLEQLTTLSGVRPRLRVLARAAFPTARQLRVSSARARRGAFGFAVARALHPLTVATQTPGAIRGWLRVRRATRR